MWVCVCAHVYVRVCERLIVFENMCVCYLDVCVLLRACVCVCVSIHRARWYMDAWRASAGASLHMCLRMGACARGCVLAECVGGCAHVQVRVTNREPSVLSPIYPKLPKPPTFYREFKLAGTHIHVAC